MAIQTAWLIGAFEVAAGTKVVVNGVDVEIAEGPKYLHDATPALSLITELQTGIAAEVPGATVVVQRDRKIRIDFNGVPTTLVVPSALAEILGFTSSPYGATTSRTAEAVSRLLWSPGWPETTTGSPVGVEGRKVHDRVMKSSPTGLTTRTTRHSTTTMLDVSWVAVAQGRAWTPAEAPGEYVDFFDRVICEGKPLKFYSQVTEDDASTTAVTWPTGFGPYVVPKPNYDWYERFVSRSDSLGANISISLMKTGEYS